MENKQSANVTKQQAIAEFWRRGNLFYKLDPIQREMHSQYYNKNDRSFTWLLARRSGKSFLLSVLAIETCIRKPNSIVKFVAPTKLMLMQILRPIFKKILSDCPTELHPDYREKDFVYYFKNGSEIQLAATENQHAEKLRGGDSDAIFIDESGSCSNLKYIYESILFPTTLITKGRIVLAGTPPLEPDHDFLYFIEQASVKGTLTLKTIDDNPRVEQEEKERMIEELGGRTSEGVRRELYCEIIKDSTISVIPEYTPELDKKICVEYTKPPFYDTYVSMDIGFKDLTVVLFAFYDFKKDIIVIEDEIVVQSEELHLDKLTADIMHKEFALWTNPLTNETKTPVKRVSDIDYIAIEEIRKISKDQLLFQTTEKKEKDAIINKLRLMLANGKIIINPRCKSLRQHLLNVKWKSVNDKTRFARSADHGHYDACDAALYLIRNIDYSKNPYPSYYGLNTNELFIQNKNAFNSSQKNSAVKNEDLYRTIMNLKPKRRGNNG